MLYFPQLSSGSIVQFPFGKEIRLRTVVNQMGDGRQILWADADGGTVRWRMGLEHLSDEELEAIRGLFDAAEGRLRTFVFPDPAANLFRWSFDLTKPVWQADALVSVVPGAAGEFTISNTGAVSGKFRQTLGLPSAYQLSLSASVRASSELEIELFLASSSGTLQRAVSAGPEWRLASFAGAIGGLEELVDAGLILPPGSSVEVRQPQLEAQLSPSLYKPAGAVSGLFTGVRFDMDRLVITTHAPGDHSTELILISRLGGQNE